MIERKIRYNGTTAEYDCDVLDKQPGRTVLFYTVPQSFTFSLNDGSFQVPGDTQTAGFYWNDRPYNVYIWHDRQGEYVGAYINIVKNTVMTDTMVSYEDLIIDLLVRPNGDYFVLDEEELPKPLNVFEQGSVQNTLQFLKSNVDAILSPLRKESKQLLKR